MMLEQAYQLSLSPVPVLVEYPPTFTTRDYRGSVPGFINGIVGVWRFGHSEKWFVCRSVLWRQQKSRLSVKSLLKSLMFVIPKFYNIYRIYNRSVYNTTILFIYIKVVYCQGDMFRPSPGHLQTLEEKQIQDYIDFFYKNALWDPTMNFYKKNLRNLGSVFLWGPEDDPVKVETCRPDNMLL